MISFIYSAPCWVCILFLIQPILTCLLWFYPCSCYSNNYRYHLIMPVTTRSKAKSRLSSINEASNFLSTTNLSTHEQQRSINELNHTIFPSDGQIDGSSSPVLTNTQVMSPYLISSQFHHDSSSIPVPFLPSSESFVKLDSSIFQFENLEFQNLEDKLPPGNCPVQYCHNFSNSKKSTMEADCKDHHTRSEAQDGAMDMTKLFTMFSEQMLEHTTKLQEKLSSDFTQLVQAQANFKQEVRDELDELRYLISIQNHTSSSGPPVNQESGTISSASIAPTVSSSPTVSQPSITFSGSNTSAMNGQDLQNQMMMMLTESFSKLSSVLVDKSAESKSDWPKFSGDSKKFRAWYMAIMAQLSLPPWQDLYDSSTNDVVATSTNSALNGKLYSKLLLSLEGQPLQDIITRSHLRANGLLLLQELSQTYRPRNVPEVIAAKTGEFWSKMKRRQNETIDSYFNRFHELLEDISESDDKISDRSAMRHFLFTLGSEFEPIQNQYRIGNLPSEWKTTHWPTLLVLCRDFYHSVNPSGIMSKETSQDGPSDRIAQHRKKIKQWFLNPLRYSKEIAAEQTKHPGQCIYHLSSSHLTEDCHIKIDCDKRATSKKPGTQPSNVHGNIGQLRHITEEVFEDAADTADCDSKEELVTCNDTNDVDLLYFVRVSKHYLRLAKTTPTKTSHASRHPSSFPVIADSGANFHMFKEPEFFESMVSAQGSVILGDGTTRLAIQGMGTVVCKVGNNILRLENVRFVPSLSESIYSLLLHIKQPNQGLESSFEGGLFLKFPHFTVSAVIGDDDIYLDAIPIHLDTTVPVNSSTSLPPLNNETNSTFCRQVLQLQEDIEKESSYLDSLLQQLKDYYATITTKRQLNMEVPAGFRRTNELQKNMAHSKLLLGTPLDPGESTSMDLVSELSSQYTDKEIPLESPVMNDSLENTNLPLNQVYSPIIRSVDKPSSSLPRMITFSEDLLRASVGFRRVDSLKQYLPELYQHTIRLDSLPADAVLDEGNFASLRKKNRNTVPIKRPSAFGDVVHMDIVFGPEISVGNIHYGLLFSDRYSRMTYIYPLQNLTSDIPKQMSAFFAHIGITPKRLLTDFDLKLIGGKARDYLNSLLIHVNAAPSHHQDKNGLAERHWQTMVCMARNWLASAELPSTYWFYAVRRASEVCNYFPYRLDDGTVTTPFELAHNEKPDLRVLFKPFSLAAVRRERVGDNSLSKFDSQSVPMICIGRCPNSNGLQFYNPVNCTFVSSIDYVFIHGSTAGARFGYTYQPGLFIYKLDETTTLYHPKFMLDTEVYVHTHSPPHVAKIVGLPSYERPNIYTVQFADGSISEYSDDKNILEAKPICANPSSSILLPHWVQHGTNITLFLSNMQKPKHGKLYQNSDSEWVFCPGNSVNVTNGIVLPDLSATIQQLLDSGQIFKGHAKFKRVYSARAQLQLRDCVLRHVSAHGLSSLVAPSSLKSHSKLSPSDKSVWDDAYFEEYDGLSSLPTWEVLTEQQYKSLYKDVKSLPSMAIATIKYDEFNRPKRAKYRIVVLGNHDYHTWSKDSTAAPVMSQLELRLLTSLAIYHKRIMKNCDIKQAFVQSSLPEDEIYLVRPPSGCPKSPPGTYWRLLRSLYGLRRAPKLWFEKLSNHLHSMGLQSSPNSPCLFVGSIIPGLPPIYVGIYVDDIIYFSQSDEVEKQFETLLSTIGNIDFMGQVSHFLGIEFTWKHLPNGHLSVSLTQQSFTDTLLDSLGILVDGTSTYTTPYQSHLHIDSISTQEMSTMDRDQLRLKFQSLVGSLNWLAHTTRPDLSTVVSLLAQHQCTPSSGHYDAAIYVAKYLATTRNLGIYFSSERSSTLTSFLHFPIPTSLLSMSDANWGPQDASLSSAGSDLPLFVSRSMSAYYVDLFGPLHWLSKRQSVTAGSSAEAEIYATDECVKFLLELDQLMEFLQVKHLFMPSTNTIYNDNSACVNWSKKCTTKGLRHIQMRENRVRENVSRKFVQIIHVNGKLNLADLFTKEIKDVGHFVELRDIMMRPRLLVSQSFI